jgi:hypothetical protein
MKKNNEHFVSLEFRTRVQTTSTHVNASKDAECMVTAWQRENAECVRRKQEKRKIAPISRIAACWLRVWKVERIA